MVIVRDWQKYYTIEESIEIGNKMIEKSWDELLIMLKEKKTKIRKANLLKDKQFIEWSLDTSEYKKVQIKELAYA